ncbi:MAG: Na(+)-translocating NADH-quinone reductase subunit C [Gammaproteobacteria bacterium]
MTVSDLKQSLTVILSVCLVCSLMVSSAAILLNEKQKENSRQNRVKNILVAAGLYEKNADNEAIYKRRIEPLLIELKTGKQVDESTIGPDFTVEAFDIMSFANDPRLGTAIDSENDIAKINRRPRFMVVYIAKTDGRPDKLILPVYGKGLWSTLFGLLALDRDLQTISGITFYQHGETPGLGGEIENPGWQRQWQGKQAFGGQGGVVIEVVRGEVDEGSGEAYRQIDGLAGATLTSRGVQKLLHYWLGEEGYGPLLEQLRQRWSETAVQKTGRRGDV